MDKDDNNISMVASMHDGAEGGLAETSIPGTVHLVDLLGTMQAKHAEGGRSDIVLVPAPSADPDDPLNWSPARKQLSTVCMCVYTLMIGIASAAIYSVLGPISQQTGLTLGDLNQGTGVMFLAFGWGCLVWQPLALQYGKRPVYLISMLSTVAIQLWAPYTLSSGQWIANKILQGFFGAPIESLCEISVTDIYFTHERGGYLGLYALLLAGSNFFAPVIAGFINDAMGWQWVLYWCAIFCAIGFIFLFFFMEETNYVRLSCPTDRLAEAARSGSGSTHTTHTTASPPPTPPRPATSTASGFQPKTYRQKLQLFQKADLQKANEMRGMVTRPLKFLTFPVILYAGFLYGSQLVWFNVLNGTTSLILGQTYGFSSSIVGLSYLSCLVGVALGAAYTGWAGDRFVISRARANGGVLESEHRLWLFAPSLVLVPGGLMLWGVGAAHGVHWFGPVFAMGVVAFTNTLGIQLSVAYCIDSYRALSGEAIITVILVRNTMSFGIGYGLTPWVTNMGLQNAFLTAALLGFLQLCTVWLMIWYGKGFRERSVDRYAKYVDIMTKSGMVH